jgi:hypothetical protein
LHPHAQNKLIAGLPLCPALEVMNLGKPYEIKCDDVGCMLHQQAKSKKSCVITFWFNELDLV